MKAVVVLVVLLPAMFAHAAPSIKIAPPPGWLEDHTVGDEQLAKLRSLPGILQAELRQWKSPEGNASLQVVEFEVNSQGHSANALIERAEVGAMRGAGSARQLSLTRREQNDVVVIDHVVEDRDIRIHHRRHYAIDNRGRFHNIAVACAGPAGADDVPACATSLATASWLFKPVSPTMAKVNNIAFQIGQIIGYVGIAGFLAWLVIRLSRKKPAR